MTATGERTRPVGRTARNLLLWCGAVVLAAILLVVLGPKPQQDVYLDPEGTGKQGIGALVEVLRDQGITVTTTTTSADLDRARTDLGDAPVTVAVGATTFLTASGARSVLGALEADDRLVLLDGGGALLPEVAPGLRSMAVQAEAEITPDCSEPLTRHGADDAVIGVVGQRFLVEDDEVEGLTTCYRLDRPGDAIARGAGLAVLTAQAHRPQTFAVGFGPALTNARITEHSHAALGLRLLGAHPHLIIHTPSIEDAVATGDAPPSTVEPPAWLVPGLALLAAAFVVYAVARGRRLGRLVREPLPVVVRASETTHSRAELYRAARDRGLAAATLRAGTLARLRPRLRLDSHADAAAVVTALATNGIPQSTAGPLLTGPAPTDDAGLVRLAQDLTTLEDKVNPR